MPRDLATLAKEDSSSTTPELTKSPDTFDDQASSSFSSSAMDRSNQDPSRETRSDETKPEHDELHPYVQVLTESDVESCTQLEQEAFPPQERCTQEKFAYRLRACGHLSLGIFTSHDPATATHDAPSTTSTSAAVYSGHPSRRAALLGLICATLSSSPTVTDAAMTLADAATHPAPAFGHDPAGRTLCLHSLAVLPAFQRRGLARTLLRAYLQRMRDARVADRVALIAHQALIPYYESFGFRSLGPSTAQFGGGGWWDMVLDFDDEEGEGMMAGDGARVGSELEVEV